MKTKFTYVSMVFMACASLLASPASFLFGKVAAYVPMRPQTQAMPWNLDDFLSDDDSEPAEITRGDTEILVDSDTAYDRERFRTLLRATSSRLNGVSVNSPTNTDGTVEIFLNIDDLSDSVRLVPETNDEQIRNRFELAGRRDSVRYARRLVITGTSPSRMWNWIADEVPMDLMRQLIARMPYLEEIQLVHVQVPSIESLSSLFQTAAQSRAFRSLQIVNGQDLIGQLVNDIFHRSRSVNRAMPT